MPLLTAVCGLPVIVALLAVPVVAVAVKHPESADAWSVVGAIVAAVIALVEAREKGRSFGQTSTVFMGCVIVGAIAPGILYNVGRWQEWIPAGAEEYLTWQVWAGAGFILGLHGWGLVHLTQRLGSRAVDFWIRKRVEKALFLPPEDEPPR